MDPDAVRAVVVLAAAFAGCRCDYEVRHGGDHVTLKHDSDCPALHAPSRWWVAPRRRR
jgi:hypothetical protein